MSGMELKLMTKLAAIDKVMYEVLSDEQRQEIATRVGWLMLECEDLDPAEGTIWEGV
jgi:hypothetical protein